ncbi:MAG: hypothetical protein FWH20_03735 [Oscillospiraceae bacterium]|nr:hypothetical protein [Oscillospiraceae bacterium]
MKIAVISGGFSEEQYASRESGRLIADALTNLEHDVKILEYDKNFFDGIRNFAPDIAFPFVQGKHHGDGTVQALLELAGIKYIGSRPQYAAIINHKTACKRIWRASDILTPDFFEYSRDEYENEGYSGFVQKLRDNGLEMPVVVKPPTQGNRFGMVFVEDVRSFDELEKSFKYDETLLVEKYVEGRFFAQGVFEKDGKMTTLPPVEILDNSSSSSRFKIYAGGSEVVAHDFTVQRLSEIGGISLQAVSLTGAAGFARLDYHLCCDKLYLLEINAFPGLVPGYSSMTACIEAAGYKYDEFIEAVISTAK